MTPPINDGLKSQTQPPSVPAAATSWSQAIARLKRLATKELRETLRDRRTIITLILMPLLVYPILSLVFRSVLMSSLPGASDNRPAVLDILVQSNRSEEFTGGFINGLRQRVTEIEIDDASKASNQETETNGAKSSTDPALKANPAKRC